MPIALLLTRSSPSATGTGDQRRTYQLAYDLSTALGADQVDMRSREEWLSTRQSSAGGNARVPLAAVARTLRWHADNPYRRLSGSGFSVGTYLPREFLAQLRGFFRSHAELRICVVDDARFSAVVSQLAGPTVTICCPQNLESFEHNIAPHQVRGGLRSLSVDFRSELSALVRFSHRLAISKVEAGTLHGLGLPTAYYPYLPVGEVRRRLQAVARQRADCPPRELLFLMLTNMRHHTSRTAAVAFLRHVVGRGLPAGMTLVIAGVGSERLSEITQGHPRIHARGWLSQPELDEALNDSVAVLAPQCTGFGALTRIPEMSCAQIPILTSLHTTYALNPPPGVHAIPDGWDHWLRAMEAGAEPSPLHAERYLAWERQQPRPLHSLLRSPA